MMTEPVFGSEGYAFFRPSYPDKDDGTLHSLSGEGE
jgi:hypothetical protein